MSATVSGMTANRADRAPTSYQDVPDLNDRLRDAAHDAARLGSGAYDRVARFFGSGARTLHLGVSSLAERYSRAEDAAALMVGSTERAIVRGASSLADRYSRAEDAAALMVGSTERAVVRGAAAVARGYNHTEDAATRVVGSTARAAARGAEAVARGYGRVEDAATRVVGRVANAATGTASTVRAAPAAFVSLMRHMVEMRRGAADGIKDGILEAGRSLGRGGAQVAATGRRTRDAVREAASAHVSAVAAFSQAARGSRPVEAVTRMAVNAASEAGRLRRWSAGLALGVAMTTRLAAETTVQTATRAGRFFSDGSLAVQVGATEGLRRIAASRQLRVAGYVAGVGGLVALGFGAGIHAPDLARGVDAARSVLPTPDAVVASVARGAHRLMDPGMRVEVAGADAARDLASRAMRAGTSYWTHVASAFGQSTSAHELVRVAGSTHVSGVAEAYAQPTGHAHAAHQAVAHGQAVHHGHHGHHGHGAVESRPGDRVADSLNGAELLKIKLDTLGAAHGAGAPGHHLAAATGHPQATPSAAPTPDRREIHQAAAHAAPGLRAMLPSMPHVQMFSVSHELGLVEALADGPAPR